MFKKIILCAAIFLLAAAPSSAFESSGIKDNSISSDIKATNYDFDILLIDAVLPDNVGAADVLQSITIYNTRNADNTDISKITLWADDGDGIWQGYMIDSKITDAVMTDFRRWVFKDIGLLVPVGGLHIYISAETDIDVATDRKMQFEIEKLIDTNSNGSYDAGDTGVFMASANDGPVGESAASKYVYTLENKTGDALPPKVAISDLKNGSTAALVDNFTISGYVKDRMRGSVASLRISLAPIGADPVWHDTTSLTANFASWNYTFSGLSAGKYDLQTFAADGDGNSVISDLIAVTFIAPTPTPTPTFAPNLTPTPAPTVTPTPLLEVQILDGDLIRVKNSFDVFIVKIAGAKKFKRLILNPAIFNSYGHLKWENIKDVSQVTADSYNLSDLIIEVKADGSIANPKVYRVSSVAGSDTGVKRWLNITAAQFDSAGLDWDSLYKVNQTEASKSFYPEGTAITSI